MDDKVINFLGNVEEDPNSKSQEKKFVFDHVFGQNSLQTEVFDVVAKPVLGHAFNGYNATIFAYGQTGSGKTHTMEGKTLYDEDDKGIIPRTMDGLFTKIEESEENIEFVIQVTYLEIYNEKVQDLLDPTKQNLQIKDDPKIGIYVKDASEISVNNPSEMKDVMTLGASNRSVAATRMNATSSRSHSIFCIKIRQRNVQTDELKTSKLYFIDLAGSEKIAKTHVKGKQLDEAKNINKSLSAQGLVINALVEKKDHIPYRDSKLTRMLQESLGGNALTTLLIASSMCSYNDKETLSTLRFGERAKSIKNKATANVVRSAKELQMLLDTAEERLNKYEELFRNMEKGVPLQSLGLTSEIDKFNKYTQTELARHLDMQIISENKEVDEQDEMNSPRFKEDNTLSTNLVQSNEQTFTVNQGTGSPNLFQSVSSTNPNNSGVNLKEKASEEETPTFNHKLDTILSEDNRFDEEIDMTDRYENLDGEDMDNQEHIEEEADEENDFQDNENIKNSMQKDTFNGNTNEEDVKEKKSGIKLIKQSMRMMDLKNKVKSLSEELRLGNDELESRTQQLMELQEKNVNLEDKLKSIQNICNVGFNDISRKFDKFIKDNQDKNTFFDKLDREFETVKLQQNFLCNDSEISSSNSKKAKPTNIKEVSSMSKETMKKVITNLEEVQSKFQKNKVLNNSTHIDDILSAISKLSNCFNIDISQIKSGRDKSNSELIEMDLSTEFCIGGEDFENTTNISRIFSYKQDETLGIDVDEEILGIINEKRNDTNEKQLNELQSLINAQRHQIDSLHKMNSTLTEDKLRMKKKMGEKMQKNKEKIEEFKNKLVEKEQTLQNKVILAKTENEDLKKEIYQWELKNESLRTQMNNDLTKKGAEIFQLQKVMSANKNARSQYDLEQKLSAMISERQNQFSHVYNLESKLNEFEDMMEQKTDQVKMLKDQIKVLMKEVDANKKITNQGQFFSQAPSNVIKTVRGGGGKTKIPGIQKLENPNMYGYNNQNNIQFAQNKNFGSFSNMPAGGQQRSVSSHNKRLFGKVVNNNPNLKYNDPEQGIVFIITFQEILQQMLRFRKKRHSSKVEV